MPDTSPLTFTAIDFETANDKRNSVCAVGLAVVENGEVVARRNWLVRPPELRFMEYLMTLHGITASQVRDKPEFDVLWPEVSRCIRGPLVAHNATFDMSVLRHVLDTYDIPQPELDFFCSLELARSRWPELPRHSLGALAQHLEIPLAHHHEAGDDAYASALVVVLAARELQLRSLLHLLDAHGLTMRHLRTETLGPTTPYARRPRAGHFLAAPPCRPTDIVPRVSEFDQSHPFFGQMIAFTGTLETMSRVEAWQAVADRGGTCTESMSKKVKYLVAGVQDLCLLNGHDKSTKMRKAEALCAKGCPIEIILEVEFLRLLGG